MDPLSLGLAVAVLLATGFSEGFAGEAGADVWKSAKQMVGRLREKVTPSGRQALDRIEDGTSGSTDTTELGAAIADVVRVDAGLREQLEQLVERASADDRSHLIVQQAFDQARQINITGPNFGPITMGDS